MMKPEYGIKGRVGDPSHMSSNDTMNRIMQPLNRAKVVVVVHTCGVGEGRIVRLIGDELICLIMERLRLAS